MLNFLIYLFNLLFNYLIYYLINYLNICNKNLSELKYFYKKNTQSTKKCIFTTIFKFCKILSQRILQHKIDLFYTIKKPCLV